MDIKTLYSSISQFSLLSSNNFGKSEIVQSYCQKVDEILNLLKPVLNEVLVSEVPLDEELNTVVEELHALINDTREIIESLQKMSSKLYIVLQIESVITKIQAYVFKTCQLLSPIFESLPIASHLACVERCTEKLQNVTYDPISDSIKGAMRDQIENAVPRSECLLKIADSLSLSSNQELLMEAVALETLKTKVTCGENHGELEYIDPLIVLINYMHDCHIRVKQLHSIKGVPIPADFCCPLSLELMSDPVIVASGQTYERAFIRKWLDEGFIVCPKTRQTLGHTNLIPNYTVKALIVNWCESNNIKLPDPMKLMNLNRSSTFITSSDSCPDVSNVPTPSHPSNVHPRSLESSTSVMNLHNNSHLSNENHQNGYANNESPSPCLHSVSNGLALYVANGIGSNITRIKISSFDGKETTSEAQDSGFCDRTPNQSENEGLQDDEQLQHCNGTASASSSVSSTGYLQGSGDVNQDSQALSDLVHYGSDTSGEMAQESPASSAPPKHCTYPPRPPDSRSRGQTIWRRSSEMFVPRITSSSMDTRPDLSAVETQVHRLIEDLKSDSIDLQKNAAHELRLLAKHNMENRIVIAGCGAISHLVSLLHSTDPTTQEHAVTALLNLSINDNNKTAIANAGAIDPLIHVLESGNAEAKENSAATLYSLSVVEENKTKIGRSGAIKQLVEMLRDGTPHGKRDAATALYNLSISHENKARIVQAGAVRHLVELMDPAAGMVDKAVSVLANLARIPEGRTAIGKEGGIPFLVEVVELGSAKGREHAAAALLCLCTSSNKFSTIVLQEGVVPPLVALSQSGTPRAKEKAHSLLTYFRNQRHGNGGRS